jgi:exopolysaccharide biosynthesis predicted pyruvyltransferase EpsI
MTGARLGDRVAPPPGAMRAAVAALRARLIAILSETLGPWRGAPYALVDFPSYANPGDSAIWAGTRSALAACGFAPPAYACDKRTFEPALLARRVGAGPILVHGGGNFGDVYASHQRLREEVVRRFPGNPVVQLPQSIHFEGDDARRRAREAFRAHPRFVLLVRDEASRRRAREDLGLDARLCPDLSIALGPLPRRGGGGGIVWIARHDAWARHAPPEDAADVRAWDWPVERLSARRLWVSLLGRGIRAGLGRPLALRRVLSRTYDPAARRRLTRALAGMAPADVVVTDRLHGHVFALLLGIPHVVLDDRTGKIHALHATWTPDVPGIVAARDPDEALAAARAMRDAAGREATA